LEERVNVLVALVMTTQVSGLAGVWKKDPARSDDARQKMQAVFQQVHGEGARGGGMHGGGGGMHGGGGGMHGGGMHGGGHGQGGPGSGGGPMGMGMVTAADELTLELEETEFRVLDGTRTRAYTLDGEKHESESETPNGGKLETTAQQLGNAVSIEEKMSRGKVDRKFEVSPDGQTLIVTSTVELGSMKEPVVIKSVYIRPPAS
jgi:hypothetical protein